MENYQQSKKARYITSVVYLLILGFLVIGTLVSEQHKREAASSTQENLSVIK